MKNKIIGAIALALTLIISQAAMAVGPGKHEVEVGDDGLHKQPWFSVTFKDIREDIEDAAAEGKRLVIIVEQRGCIYCKRLHEYVLADPEVGDYIKANFKMVQYNMFGDEEVTDLDGEVLSEKKMLRRWGMIFTPTIAFLPEKAPESGTLAQAAVSIVPGAFGKWPTMNMFRWVRAKGYNGEENFQKFNARMMAELKAAGRLNN